MGDNLFPRDFPPCLCWPHSLEDELQLYLKSNLASPRESHHSSRNLKEFEKMFRNLGCNCKKKMVSQWNTEELFTRNYVESRFSYEKVLNSDMNIRRNILYGAREGIGSQRKWSLCPTSTQSSGKYIVFLNSFVLASNYQRYAEYFQSGYVFASQLN